MKIPFHSSIIDTYGIWGTIGTSGAREVTFPQICPSTLLPELYGSD